MNLRNGLSFVHPGNGGARVPVAQRQHGAHHDPPRDDWQALWSRVVVEMASAFNVAANAFAPSQRDERHRQLGTTWKNKSTRQAGTPP